MCCHLLLFGPFGFLFWGERLRNIVLGPWLIEHVSQTDGFPNWILTLGPFGKFGFAWSAGHAGNAHSGPSSLLAHYMVSSKSAGLCTLLTTRDDGDFQPIFLNCFTRVKRAALTKLF